ncbi:MAG: CBS domain-containing protein [Phaeodactylibacter sp.]|nr:CBS domain-containing protein [Phaeodactylibacter sp.]MCB9303128.1 CBS domain-containing protein [Lewinellaceae bacterium]
MDLNASVSTIMTTDVKIAGPDDATSVLDELFRQHRIHHVPIVEEEGTVLGIVSKSDFLYLLRSFGAHESDRFREAAKLRAFKVKEIMVKQVETIHEDEPIKKAVALFSQNRFRCLPVVNAEDHLVGIITTQDIIQMVNALE